LHEYAAGHHFYTIDNTPFDTIYHWDKDKHPNSVAIKSFFNSSRSKAAVSKGFKSSHSAPKRSPLKASSGLIKLPKVGASLNRS